jgi:uncharacterized membrane protein YdbT with pleckstrin-like domain
VFRIESTGVKNMLVALALSAGVLGAVWVYIIPYLQGWVGKFIPADIMSNKIVQVAATGAFLLIAVFIATLIVKKTRKVVKA